MSEMASAAAASGTSNAAMAKTLLTTVLVQLVAPRLEAPTDLAGHLALRQLKAMLARHLGDDRHVVLGPSHGLHAPLGERVVLRARHEERLAQHVGIQAEAAGERQRLMVSDEARPQDQVVCRLGDLRAAGRSGVHDVAGEGAEHRSQPLHRSLVATDEAE